MFGRDNIIPRQEAVERIAERIRVRDNWIIQINPFDALNEVTPLASLPGFMAYMDCALPTICYTDNLTVLQVACAALSPGLSIIAMVPKAVLAGELSIALNQDVRADGTQDMVVPYDPAVGTASWCRLFIDALEKVHPEVVEIIKRNEVKL